MRSCWIILPLIFSIFGCGEPGVRKYSVPKPHTVAGFNDQPAEKATEYRILGAIVSTDKPSWFFKATGTKSTIDAFETEFDAFMKSVSFPKGLEGPPEWVKPDGVTMGQTSEFRFATLVFTVKGKPVELTVSQAKGDLEGNIKRWIGQVESPLKAPLEATTPLTFSEIKGVKVSLTGSKNPSGGPMMGGFR